MQIKMKAVLLPLQPPAVLACQGLVIFIPVPTALDGMIDEFDQLTAAGWKLDLIEWKYFRPK